MAMFGAASYTCPTDKSICYSVNSPATNATFIDLQSQVNKFAHVAGFALIAQDGLIGDGTVTATKKAMSYAASKLPDGEIKATVIALQPFAISRQILAPSAEGVGTAIRQAAIQLGLAAPSSGGGGGGSPPIIPTLPPGQIVLPGIPSSGLLASMSPTTKALLGVGAAVGVGSLVLIFWKPKKKAATMSGYRRRR